MKHALAGVAVVLVAATLTALEPSDAAAPPTRVEPTEDFETFPCPDGLLPPDLDVTCGSVVVPEDRSAPDGRQIRVAAAVVHATDPDPRTDPIVFVNGGPSVGTIQRFAPELYFGGWDYVADRDIVLVDTRGTGISRPRLGCRELDRADVRAQYAGRFIYDRSPEITGRALDACWDRLTERGIDLASYNSEESAADLEALRLALGVDEWNLVALSADGTVGLTYLRLYPDGIRSVVVDSGIPPNVVQGVDYLRGESRLTMRLLNGCRDDAACDARYPGLRRKVLRLVRELNEDPVIVSIPDYRPTPIAVKVDGGGLMSDLAYAAWPGGGGSRSEIPSAVAVAWEIANGGLVRLYRELIGKGPYVNQHNNQFTAMGKSMSYFCHDLVGFVTRADLRRAAEADRAHARRLLGRQFDLGQGWNNILSPEGCSHWPVGRAAPVQHEPVVSDVPALVLAGTYDVLVPPLAVRRALTGLTNGAYVEMPTSAHVALAAFTRGSWCARRITAGFLDDPAAPVGTSCLADLRPIDFAPREGSRRLDLGPEGWHRGAPAWLPRRAGG